MSPSPVVILGAGVVGAAVAYHLARRGVRDIVVLDRGAGPGEGSTGRATGGFRAQYATRINVRLSLLSRKKLLDFPEEVGGECGYRPAGYLWLAGSEEELAILREGRVLQHQEGLLEAREVDREEIARLNPALALDEVAGGAFCPTDGFIRPLGLLAGYLAAAQRLGVRVEWQTDVTALPMGADGRVEAVETSRGRFPAASVVNAAGPWAGRVAALAGVDLPVVPLRRQVLLTEPFDGLPDTMPMTVFATDGFHLRVRDGRVLMLWPTEGVPDLPFDTRVEPDWIEAVLEKAHRRVPILRNAVVDREGSWAGLYEMSPDKHAILGPAPGCPNLYLINGSSGHGVMHAPALSQLLAEIMVDGAATTLDVSALSPERFASGALNPVSGLL